MKKLVLLLVFLFCVSVGYGALTDNLLAYYKLDTNNTLQKDEVAGSYNGTLSNTTLNPLNVSGKINNSLSFNTSISQVGAIVGTFSAISTGNFTVSAWVNPHVNRTLYYDWIVSKNTVPNLYIAYNLNNVYVQSESAGLKTFSIPTLSVGSWYHIVVVRNNTAVRVFLNGVESSTGSVLMGGEFRLNQLFCYYQCNVYGYGSNSSYDEVGIWNRAISDSEVLLLYNGSYGLAYPFSYPNFYANVTNRWNGSAVQNVSLYMVNGSLNYTFFGNGTVSTNLSIDSGFFNITTSSPDYFTTYNFSYDLANSVLGLSIFQSIVNLSNCTEKVSGSSLVCLNQSVVYPNAGSYNFSNNVSGYYGRREEVSLNALDNITLAFSDFFSGNVSLRSSFLTGAGTGNCSYNISSLNYTWSELVVSSVTNSSIGLINGSYVGVVNCEGYALSNVSFVVNSSVLNVTFYLYNANSVNIFIYNQSTGSLLTGVNVTTLFNDGTNQVSNVTSTGLGFVFNLSVGVHVVSASASGYETSYYYVIVTNQSNQSLNIYLLESTSNSVSFVVKDSDTGDLLDGVSVVVEAWVNDTKVSVLVLLSDVTGTVVHAYESDTTYVYNFSLSGYEDKTFSLSPITSASYTILIDALVSYNYDVDYANVLIYYSPKLFKNNYNYNISFTFSDADESLSYYGFNASFNGVTVESSGTSSGGSTLTKNITLNTSSLYDTLVISYWYKRVGGERHDFTDKYNIYNGGSLTWAHNRDTSYGMGWFERLLIATIIMMVIAGMMAWAGLGGTGVGIGVLIGILISSMVGLVPLSVFWVSIVPLIIIIWWRSSQ